MLTVRHALNALFLLASQDTYTLKVDVPVVSIDVVVSNSDGSLINGLSKNDFQIAEDGIAQEIQFFSPVSAPYNALLLFDPARVNEFETPRSVI